MGYSGTSLLSWSIETLLCPSCRCWRHHRIDGDRLLVTNGFVGNRKVNPPTAYTSYAYHCVVYDDIPWYCREDQSKILHGSQLQLTLRWLASDNTAVVSTDVNDKDKDKTSANLKDPPRIIRSWATRMQDWIYRRRYFSICCHHLSICKGQSDMYNTRHVCHVITIGGEGEFFGKATTWNLFVFAMGGHLITYLVWYPVSLCSQLSIVLLLLLFLPSPVSPSYYGIVLARPVIF